MHDDRIPRRRALMRPDATGTARVWRCCAALTVVAALAGCASSDPETTPSSSLAVNSTPSTITSVPPTAPEGTSVVDPTGPPITSTGPPPAVGAALEALAGLEVKGRAPKTGYASDQFGPTWADTDRNGCDTRNDILRRDLTAPVVRANGCTVQSGTLPDPYTGPTIDFLRGQDTSNAVQIDHVVALSNAWQTGAAFWSPETRLAFANDPLELLAVDGPANEAKGDGDAATWLPPNKAFRCAYVARQVAVKARYRLWVTPPERDAITRVLAACPAQTLPSD